MERPLHGSGYASFGHRVDCARRRRRCGHYQTIGGQTRTGVAATVPGTTTVTSWDPVEPRGYCDAIGVSSDYVFTSDLDVLSTFSKATAARATFSPKHGGGAGYLVRPDRLIIYGVGEVDYVATNGLAEFLGTP